MDDPIKVIHEFKNRNQKIQYNLLIYVGNIMEKKTNDILMKIKDLDFYQTMIELTDDEYKQLVSAYSEYWYQKFFITYHIEHMKKSISSNKTQLSNLTSKYGDKWMKQHIKQSTFKTPALSYESKFHNDKLRSIKKKELFEDLIADTESANMARLNIDSDSDSDISERSWSSDDSDNDFDELDDPEMITLDKALSQKISDMRNPTEQSGGDDDDDEEDAFTAVSDVFDDPDEGVDLPLDNDNTVEEENPFFQNDEDEIDKNIKETTDQIKEVVKTKTYQFYQKMIEIDVSKDNDPFDQDIKNVYKKNYVENQYIFKDDTIHTIRSKICISLKNAPRFGEDCYILPSYQYLWTEYNIDNQLKRVMLGSKFMVKNNLMNIDVKPNNNLRHYQELRDNLKSIYDIMNRPGKFKREDDDTGILFDYEEYYTNNEIFMIDIMNQLGFDFHPDIKEFDNMIKVYFDIYFPRIRPDELQSIIEFLSPNKQESVKSYERNRMKNVHKSINSILLIEYDIMRDVELVKAQAHKNNYKKYFQENHITQTVIHTSLTYEGVYDLYYIFDNFISNKSYPFIQYQPIEHDSVFKFYKPTISKPDLRDTFIKWFENSPHGISFRLRLETRRGKPIMEEKYMTINLSDSGRIEYKIPWKEEHQASIEDIIESYQYIYGLIDKINSENKTFQLIKPEASQFKFAFISSIQRFSLPGNYSINHDDISDFSRYFFPYITLMIEPRKRKSKSKEAKEEFGKYGTYLRYRRISKYEVNSKIENRIIQIMKNYEYDDQSLANLISRDFNITEGQAMSEIATVRQKHPNIRKARIILKKLDTLTKPKTPGISINIQGKTKDNYIIRTSGARDQVQLDRIINFTNILIYLYYETYLLKIKERQSMLDKLKTFVNIAQRRNRVEKKVWLPIENDNVISVKQMIKSDYERLGQINDDENWAKECQQSGLNKRRRPKDYIAVGDLIQAGYKYNEKTDFYERQVEVADEKNNKKKNKVILRAVKLAKADGGDIFYTCSPEENGKQMYVGFLARNIARPCCFIKDQYTSVNKAKKNNYLRNIGKFVEENEVDIVNTGDKLYILQDTNKIPEGRFGFMPKYLDIFMNFMLGNDKRIDNNHFVESKSGYYFKYGISKDRDRFLHCLAVILDMTVQDMKERITKVLTGKNGNMIFTAINNGEVKNEFETPEKYLESINNIGEEDTGNLMQEQMPLENENTGPPQYGGSDMSHGSQLLMHFLSLPGVLHKNGLSILLFQKKVKIIHQILEKEKIRENYYLVCQNEEESDYIYQEDRPVVIIIKDGQNFYPVIKLKKKENEKDIQLEKIYYYSPTQKNNIINHVKKFYDMNCHVNDRYLLLGEKDNLIAKRLVEKLALLPAEFQAKSQLIDSQNKCRYIITKNSLIIPTNPSGSLYNLTITTKITNEMNKTIDEMLDLIDKFNKLEKNDIKITIEGVHYENTESKNDVVITGLILDDGTSIPLKTTTVTKKSITDRHLYLQQRTVDETIDKLLIHVPLKTDMREMSVRENDYKSELYQLFRLEISEYLNEERGKKDREMIEKTIGGNQSLNEKQNKIKKIIYQICSAKLSRTFTALLKKVSHLPEEQDGGAEDDLVYIYPDTMKIDYLKFQQQNHRQVSKSLTKTQCENDLMRYYSTSGECHLAVRQNDFVDFVNKMTEELINNEVKSSEILQYEGYSVSKIVNRTIFSERKDQMLLRATNKESGKVFVDLFGEEKMPVIGRKRRIDIHVDTELLKTKFPLKEIKYWYVQQIIENNNTIYRAVANAINWLVNIQKESSVRKNEKPDNERSMFLRNLGYYNEKQTSIANVYKAKVIDWLLIPKNQDGIVDMVKKYESQTIDQFIHRVSTEVSALSEFLVELHILSIILNRVVNVFNENYQLIYYFNGGMKSKEEAKGVKNAINLQYIYTSSHYPQSINVIYPK